MDNTGVISLVFQTRHELNLIRGRHVFLERRASLLKTLGKLIDGIDRLSVLIDDEDVEYVRRKLERFATGVREQDTPSLLVTLPYSMKYTRLVGLMLSVFMFDDETQLYGSIFNIKPLISIMRRQWKSLIRSIDAINEGNGLKTLRDFLPDRVSKPVLMSWTTKEPVIDLI